MPKINKNNSRPVGTYDNCTGRRNHREGPACPSCVRGGGGRRRAATRGSGAAARARGSSDAGGVGKKPRSAAPEVRRALHSAARRPAPAPRPPVSNDGPFDLSGFSEPDGSPGASDVEWGADDGSHGGFDPAPAGYPGAGAVVPAAALAAPLVPLGNRRVVHIPAREILAAAAVTGGLTAARVLVHLIRIGYNPLG